jgi:biopolymer transport protein ExbD
MAMKKFDEINVVPLIDVMLVLLAMVLVTATFVVQQQLDVDLATAEHGSAVQAQGERLALTLDRTGVIRVAGEVVALDALATRMAAVGRETAVDVFIDQQCVFGTVVSVLDVLQGMKLPLLSVHTQPK